MNAQDVKRRCKMLMDAVGKKPCNFARWIGFNADTFKRALDGRPVLDGSMYKLDSLLNAKSAELRAVLDAIDSKVSE